MAPGLTFAPLMYCTAGTQYMIGGATNAREACVCSLYFTSRRGCSFTIVSLLKEFSGRVLRPRCTSAATDCYRMFRVIPIPGKLCPDFWLVVSYVNSSMLKTEFKRLMVSEKNRSKGRRGKEGKSAIDFGIV